MNQTDMAASLQSVSVTYPAAPEPVNALNDVSVLFPKATSTSIVGRSGSGKSTLVSVLTLLRTPTSGEVVLDGTVVSGLTGRDRARLRSRRVGIVFQAFHLEGSLTARDNVMLSWYFDPERCSRRAAQQRAQTILERLGIGHLATRSPAQMSGGERQRAAIGRSLFSKPALLVADEPTGNLDEETANSVAELLLALPRDFDTTVVVVTHDRAVAAKAERRLALARGRVVEIL